MSISTGQTIYFVTKFSTEEKSGVLEEQTSLGFKIGGTWYSAGDITIKSILLDSKINSNNSQLLFGWINNITYGRRKTNYIRLLYTSTG